MFGDSQGGTMTYSLTRGFVTTDTRGIDFDTPGWKVTHRASGQSMWFVCPRTAVEAIYQTAKDFFDRCEVEV